MISYFEKQMKEIEHALQTLDEEAFERMVETAVDTLDEGKKIVVSGLGKNVPICEKFVGSMVSMGLDADFYTRIRQSMGTWDL